MKKIAALLLATVLLFTMFSGCGGKDTPAPETSPESTGNGTTAEDKAAVEAVESDEEPMDIIFLEVQGREWNPEGEVFKKIEELYNINIIIEYTQNVEGQAWYTLPIAAGNTPPYIPNVTFSEYNNYVGQDIFAEVPMEWIEEFAPDMLDWYAEEVGEDTWNLYDIDGKNYALPILWSLGNHWDSYAIREDWLKDIGVDTIPETIEEYEAIFPKLKEEKQLDYIMSGTGITSFDFLSGAYDVYFGYFYEGDDGKFYRGEFHPNTKEVLTKLSDWYKKGYIDREFVINKGDQVQDKWLNSKIFIFRHYWPDFVSNEAWNGGGAMFDGLVEKEPDAKPLQIHPPKGPTGSSGYNLTNPIVGSMCFDEGLDDDVLKKYLQLFNDFSQDFSMVELANRGIEGKHFEIDDEGTYQWIGEFEDGDRRTEEGIGLTFAVNFNNYSVHMPFMTSPSGVAERIEKETMNHGKYNIMLPTYRPIAAERGTTFDDFLEKNMIDFITGARSLDEYDAFVEEAMNSYGGNEIMAEAEETYQRISG